MGRDRAADLGALLADRIDDPDGFVATLEASLVELFDPTYAVTLRRVAPASPLTHAVRSPVLRALRRPVAAALGLASSALSLGLADELARSAHREVRLFALPCLERALSDEPERSWQCLRRLGSRAADWIEVDALAAVWARGILDEPFRWAELEQLVYSGRAMERRLVGATLASLPQRFPRSRRERLAEQTATRVVGLVGQLMGDDEHLVQKSLAWALRVWTRLDGVTIEAFLRDQASISLEHGDVHRARVIRAALPALAPQVRDDLRARLAPLRGRPATGATSIAASQAQVFAASLAATGADAAESQGQRFTRVRS